VEAISASFTGSTNVSDVTCHGKARVEGMCTATNCGKNIGDIIAWKSILSTPT